MSTGGDQGAQSPPTDELAFESLLRNVARLSVVPVDLPVPARGQIIAGKYRIEERLGRGGMGLVFRATHVVSQKAVALKWMLRSSSDDHARKRFLREAFVAGRIDHPNVVDVYDLGEEAQCAYLVMELLHGETLQARLARGPLGVDVALDLLLPVMRGVSAMHQAGVIHRDLKPDNIFLCRALDGTARESKVLDFGISHLVGGHPNDHTLTQDGMLLGTPAYMSPEQLESARDVDVRADVYALGVILYQTLTGQLPFEADSYPGLVLAIVHEQPKSLCQLRPDLPAALDSIVKCALSKRRDERYPDVASLMEALSSLAQEQAARRSPRRVRWRRVLAAVGCTLALAVPAARWLSRPSAAPGAATRPVAPLPAMAARAASEVPQVEAAAATSLESPRVEAEQSSSAALDPRNPPRATKPHQRSSPRRPSSELGSKPSDAAPQKSAPAHSDSLSRSGSIRVEDL